MRTAIFRLPLAIGVLFVALHAHASTISIVPNFQTVELGEQVSFDIVVNNDSSDLVAGFDFIVSFDASLLSFADAIFGGFLGDGSANTLDIFGASERDVSVGSGEVNLAELSFIFFESILDGMQGDGNFLLATIVFNTVGLGTSDIFLTPDILGQTGADGFLSGFFGDPIAVETTGAQVSIEEPDVQLPEPSTAWLMLAGLGLLLVRRRLAAR